MLFFIELVKKDYPKNRIKEIYYVLNLDSPDSTCIRFEGIWIHIYSEKTTSLDNCTVIFFCFFLLKTRLL